MRLADTGVMRGLPGYRYVLSVYRSIVDRLLHRKITPSVESGQSFSPRDRLAAQHQSPISHPCHDSVDVSRAQRLALLNRSADHAVESSVPQLACEIDRVELLQFGPRVREELGLLLRQSDDAAYPASRDLVDSANDVERDVARIAACLDALLDCEANRGDLVIGNLLHQLGTVISQPVLDCRVAHVEVDDCACAGNVDRLRRHVAASCQRAPDCLDQRR